MTAIRFKPWVGANYAHKNRFGLRVLVLGESHYGPDLVPTSGLTCEIVRRLGQVERNRFFTKVAKVLLGLDKATDISDEARAQVWEDVAFYNYVQSIVGNSARVRPSKEMWDAASTPFREVLDRVTPDVLLVLGFELKKRVDEIEIPSNIEVCGVKHPSTGFDYGIWNPRFSKAVSRAKGRQKS